MIWILIRHAHRDTDNRALDNGLSEKGQDQAKRLRKYFKSRFGTGAGDEIELFTSPKKRCVETLEPIGELVGKKLTVSKALTEQEPGESAGAFEKRIEKFLRDCPSKNSGMILVCSHGDWIPLAVQKLCGAAGLSIEPKKGSWVEIENGKLLRALTPSDL